MGLAKSIVTFCVALAMQLMPVFGGEVGEISVAFGDNPDPDKAAFELAVARAAKRGVDVRISYLQSEDIAAQAVLSGQVDVGVGTPYALLQKHDLPIRMFFQLSRLRFFPVVNTNHFRDWADLDGADVYVHGAGSGTEAIMRVMAERRGIAYGSIRYLPGSGVRAEALVNNRILATILDGQRKRLLIEESEGPFAVLPTPEIRGSDEALFSSQAFLTENSDAIGILLDELLFVWRAINDNPGYILEGMAENGLLNDLSDAQKNEILRYYRDAVADSLFSDNGGSGELGSDLDLYGLPDVELPEVTQPDSETFWYLPPLNAALERLGRR